MKVFLLLSLFFFASSMLTQEELHHEFSLFKHRFSKSYHHSVEPLRYKIFSDNLNYIASTNSKNLSFKLGVGPFADLTYEEFSSKYLMPLSTNSQEFQDHILELDTDRIPYSLNWLSLGKVTPVKDQGNCGSCYIFASIATIESIFAINYLKDAEVLSEQQVLDCYDNEGVPTCEGGEGYLVYDYFVKHDCIVSEKDYPYTAKQEKCSQAKIHTLCVQGMIDDWKAVQPLNEMQLTAAVANQPVNAAIFVGVNLQHYSSGVINQEWCSQGDGTNHEIALIGFGVEEGMNYWIGKNSWGTDWGFGGYFLLERDPSNVGGNGACNVATKVVYPIGL